MSPTARARLGLLLLGVACSSLADISDAEECTETSCGTGFVCHQGQCVSNDEAAPRAHLGFDIRERAAGTIRFRVEVDGCDCTIEESFRELSLRRSWVSQQLFLSVIGPDDPDEEEPNGLLDAEFQITQPSRFGQSPSPQLRTIEFPASADDEPTVVLPWPRNHPRDDNVAPQVVLWKVDPVGDLAPRYLGLVPPRIDVESTCAVDEDCCEDDGCDPYPNFCNTTVGQCTAVGQPYLYDYPPECSRPVRGDVVLLEPDFSRSDPLVGVSVGLRYAEPPDERFGTPILGDVPLDERPAQCRSDDDCDPGQFCEPETRQCFVALAGRPADQGSNSDQTGEFRTQVYTYCDRLINDGPSRRYEITVVPSGPLPTVNYVVDAAFPPPPDPEDGEDDFDLGDFCIPNWGVAPDIELEGQGVPLTLLLTGDPQSLVEGAPEYACCDVGCLPATAEEAMTAPTPGPAICDGSTRAGAPPEVRVQSHFVLTNTDPWDAADCAPLNPDAEGRVGSLVRLANCGDPGERCVANDIALGTDEQPRVYEVRVQSQVGSVVASGNYTMSVTSQVPTDPLELQPRTLVTGQVVVDEALCARRDPGEDCAAREAIVLAERLRMADEPEGSVPGPYFHSVSTFYDPVAQRDGAFVLPLDPGGVYVVTALPPIGAEGGPADFTVVDLRKDAAELQPLTLVLEEGVVVTLQLDQFDPRTVVIPLDRGSYLAPGRTLLHPMRMNTADPFIDLNRVGECWTEPESEPQGCLIRRLIPPGSVLARSQVEVVRFTARRSDQAECTPCSER